LFLAKKIEKKSDAELLDLFCTTAESEYFAVLFGRYVPLVYGVCLKYLKNIDLAQDAVLQLYKSLLSIVSHSKIEDFRRWLYSETLKCCVHLASPQNRDKIIDSDSKFFESNFILQFLNEQKPDGDNKKNNKLINCLQKLPINQKVSINKFFYEEMSYQDIADETGYLLKDVKSNIQNGLQNLNICIEKHKNEFKTLYIRY